MRNHEIEEFTQFSTQLIKKVQLQEKEPSMIYIPLHEVVKFSDLGGVWTWWGLLYNRPSFQHSSQIQQHSTQMQLFRWFKFIEPAVLQLCNLVEWIELVGKNQMKLGNDHSPLYSSNHSAFENLLNCYYHSFSRAIYSARTSLRVISRLLKFFRNRAPKRREERTKWVQQMKFIH